MPREDGYGPHLAQPSEVGRSAIASRWAPRPHDLVPDPTVDELRHADGWSGSDREYPPGPNGCAWQCHDCGRTFLSRSGARKHEDARRHVVLRCDWDDPFYWDWVKSQRASQAAERP